MAIPIFLFTTTTIKFVLYRCDWKRDILWRIPIGTPMSFRGCVSNFWNDINKAISNLHDTGPTQFDNLTLLVMILYTVNLELRS